MLIRTKKPILRQHFGSDDKNFYESNEQASENQIYEEKRRNYTNVIENSTSNNFTASVCLCVCACVLILLDFKMAIPSESKEESDRIKLLRFSI